MAIDPEKRLKLEEKRQKLYGDTIKMVEREKALHADLATIAAAMATSKAKQQTAQEKLVQGAQQQADILEGVATNMDSMAANQSRLAQLSNVELQRGKHLLTIDTAKVAAAEAAVDATSRIALRKNEAYQSDLLAAKLNDQKATAEEDIAAFVRDQAAERQAALDPNTKILESLKKQANRHKEIDEFFGGFKDKFDDFADVVQDPKVASGLFAIALASEAGKFAETMFAAGENIGLSRTQSVGLADEMAGATLQGIAFGVSAKQNAASMSGLIEGAGNLKGISASTIVEVSNIARNIGIGEAEAGKLVGHMMSVQKSSIDQAKNTLITTANLARGAKVPIGKVMSDVANNMELTSKFGSISVDKLGSMAVEAAKLGTSLEQMSSLGDKLLDIDTARASAMELSVMLGRSINVDRAQQLAFEGDINGAYKEMLGQLGGIQGFSSMDYYQKKQAAELMGVTTGELERQLNLAAGLTESGEQSASATQKTAEYLSRMGGFLKENAQTAAATVNFLGSMGKGITSAIPALGKFGGAMKDKLKSTKLGGMLGHNVKDKSKDMADVGKKQITSSEKLGAGDSKGGIKKKMQNLAAGLRSMGKGTFKGIAALALAGPALVLALPSIPFLLFMGAVPLAMLQSNFKMLAAGLRSMGKGAFKGIAALALAGPALLLAGLGIPFLLFMGMVPLAMLASNFTLLASGLKSLGKGFSSILKGLAVLALLGVAMIPAAFAFNLIKGVDPASILAFSLGLGILGLAAAGLGFIFPMVALGSLALAILGIAIIPAAMAMGNLKGVDPGAITGFAIGLGLMAAAVAGMGYLLPFILLGTLSAHALGFAIAPAVEALSGLGGIDSGSIIGFGLGLGVIGLAIAGMGALLPSILLGTLGLGAIALVLPAYNAALGMVPQGLDMLGFAAGTAALGIAGILLIPGAVGFILMAGALTLFAASLLLLVPLMPVLDKLGSIGAVSVGAPNTTSNEGAEGDKGSSEVVKKLDELISVIQAGGKVVMDGKEVGKIIQLASGPIGA